MIKLSSKEKGFSLLELIVIASIIALLSSIILSRLDISRAKARDAKKIAELKTLQTALELYQLETGSYPTPGPFGETEPAMNSSELSDMEQVLGGIVDEGYLPSIPFPPSGTRFGSGDIYYYQTKDSDDGLYTPFCNGKPLGEVPYIIYFTTEVPTTNVFKLSNGPDPVDDDVTNGYCFTI